MLNLSAFTPAQLSDCLALLLTAGNDGMDLDTLQSAIKRNIQHRFEERKNIIILPSSGRRREKEEKDYKCSICDKYAVLLKLNVSDGTKLEGFSHAIQCQNRPADGTPWQHHHCGHTDYIPMRSV